MLQQQQKVVAAAAARTQCHKCGKAGHVATSCLNGVPAGGVSASLSHSDKQCFHCYQYGHVARDCPMARDNYFYLRMGGAGT